MNNKRKLLDGSEVPSLENPVQIIIYTKAPQKWKIIDMETGEQYIGSETAYPLFNNFLKEKIQDTKIGSFTKLIGGLKLKDKCFYCDNEGTYLDFAETDYISVCKKHLVMGNPG